MSSWSAFGFCGIELSNPIVNASGTFDAIAAHRAFGEPLIEGFPFSAFVSKTVTLAPRQGNPPPRLWEQAGGMINSIGRPNKGLEPGAHGLVARPAASRVQPSARSPSRSCAPFAKRWRSRWWGWAAFRADATRLICSPPGQIW